MIPKKIHYVWVGGAPKTELVLSCIESWKKYLPNYEIIEWNENNFDINFCPYISEAYAQKKWAFVADVIRAYVLYEYGGIYLDSDLELVQSPEPLINNTIVLGYETEYLLAGHVLIAQPKTKIFETLLQQFQREKFVTEEGLNQKTVTHRLSEIVFAFIGKKYLKNGNYIFESVSLYDKSIFTGREVYDRTVGIHHFKGSWKAPVELTKWQYFLFRVKLKLLKYSAVFMGNIKYINKSEEIWHIARNITTLKNKEKNKRTITKLY